MDKADIVAHVKVGSAALKARGVGKKLKLMPVPLIAWNDFCIIEEDDPEIETSTKTGITEGVAKLLESQKLFLPEMTDGFADKFQGKGILVAVGNKVKSPLKAGYRVMFAPLAGLRWELGKRKMVTVREDDIQAVLADAKDRD